MSFKSLIPAWLFLQLFWYQYMQPDLSFNVGIRISPDRLLFIAIFVMFINRVRGPRKFERIEWCMLFFTVLCTLSWLVGGADTGGSKFRWLTTLFQMAYFPFVIYYIGKHAHYTFEDVKKLLKGLLWIEGYLVICGLCEHFQINALVWPKYILQENIGDQWERLRGPFGNSSLVGAALAMCFAATSVMTLYVRGMRRQFLYLMLLAAGACVYFTYTRTVWLGFFGILVVFVASGTALKRPAAVVLGVVFLTFVVGLGSKLSLSGNTLFNRRQNTVDYRLANARLAYRVFATHPVFGIGYGQFGKGLKDYETSYGDASEMELTSGNENTVFGLLTEVGLVGFSLYTSVLFLAWKSCRKLYRRLSGAGDFKRALPVVGTAMICYFCLNSMTGDLRFHLFTHNIMFLFLGIIAGLSVDAPDAVEESHPKAWPSDEARAPLYIHAEPALDTARHTPGGANPT